MRDKAVLQILRSVQSLDDRPDVSRFHKSLKTPFRQWIDSINKIILKQLALNIFINIVGRIFGWVVCIYSLATTNRRMKM